MRVQPVFFAAMLASFLLGVSRPTACLAADPDDDAKTAKKARTAEIPTNLDDKQQRSSKRLEKMFGKLYGLPKVAEDDREIVRTTAFQTMNATHAPDRTVVDKLTNDLMDHLGKEKLTASTSFQLVHSTAEVMSGDHLSKEVVEQHLLQVRKLIADSGLTEEASAMLRDDVERLFRTAKRNDAYVEEREAEKERIAQEKADKEAKAKEEEEKAKTRKSAPRGKKSGRSKSPRNSGS